jgi:hypothetical protein
MAFAFWKLIEVSMSRPPNLRQTAQTLSLSDSRTIATTAGPFPVNPAATAPAFNAAVVDAVLYPNAFEYASPLSVSEFQ